MKTITVPFLAATWLAFAPGFLSAQGSLTPPPGAPAPTMKTLDEVEPRTPISAVPFTITEGGSYYLTANLSTTGHGIVVLAGGVTIDLNGFTITGSGSSVLHGVQINPTSRIQNVAVRNGTLVNFGAAVIIGGEGADNVLVENIQAQGGSRGLWISSDCEGAVFRNNVILPGTGGIHLTAFPGRTISAVTIENNRIFGGSGVGINLHAQDGTLRGVSVLNNQVGYTGGASISVTVGGTGSSSHSNILIDSNHSTRGESGFGIIVPENSGATVVRNFFMGGFSSISATGNTLGPWITTVGTLGTSGAAMSPWANFHN